MKWQPAGSVISVFISHASQDTRFAESLAVDLRSHDFLARTFRDVLPSDASLRDDRLDSRLGQAIDDDAFFVPVLSPAFVRSKWVGVELERALRSEVRRQEIGVIPALARRCSPPEALGLRTPSDFTRSYAEGLEDLVARLSAPKTSLTSAAERSANFQASEGAAEKLREYLAEHPEKLSSLTPRKFEELVAELFRDHFELEVQLQ